METGTLNRPIAKILPTNPDAPVKVRGGLGIGVKVLGLGLGVKVLGIGVGLGIGLAMGSGVKVTPNRCVWHVRDSTPTPKPNP